MNYIRTLRVFFIGFFILCAAYCAVSCATSSVSNPVEEKTGSNAATFSVPPAKADHLDTRAFSGLPPEARNYLSALSQAFQKADAEFILAQGERQFEAEVKKNYDNETYFALLYRIGTYAAESSWETAEKPHLKVREISHIEYISWEENGPMLSIQGKLITAEGEAVPCKIILAWRLKDPKILGQYP
jgi:hypothetical protein